MGKRTHGGEERPMSKRERGGKCKHGYGARRGREDRRVKTKRENGHVRTSVTE